MRRLTFSLLMLAFPAPAALAAPLVNAGPDRVGAVGQAVELAGSISGLSAMDFWVADGNSSPAFNNKIMRYNSTTGLTAIGPIQTAGGSIHGWPSDMLKINGVFYGIDTFWRRLYTIDPDTGIVSPILPSNNTNPNLLSSLAYDPTQNILYACDYSEHRLHSFNRTTGLTTFLAQMPLNDVHALEYVNGLLYCIDNATQALYSFPPPTSSNVQLTFRCTLPLASDELYDELVYFRGEFYASFHYLVGGVATAQVRKINISTGQTTPIGPALAPTSCHTLYIVSLPEDAAWSVVSGPGSVTFAAPSSPTSTANFSQPGTYLLQLTVFADPAPVSDTVTVTVYLNVDCNSNGTADGVELAGGGAGDCNSNGTPDSCDIAGGAADCGTDGTPDVCQLAGQDCNTDGTLDVCQLGGEDCDTDGSLEACEPPHADCNTDGSPDDCELAGQDCNTNQVPDVCDLAANAPDCNTNGVTDVCELPGQDCNTNELLDVCELTGGDCNTNATLDACDLAVGAHDCNTNGRPDVCDVPALDPDMFVQLLLGMANAPELICLHDQNDDGVIDGEDIPWFVRRRLGP